MQDNSNVYSGSWYEGKQHGYGCVLNSKTESKYGIWSKGEKLIKLTPEQANDIQDEQVDMSVQPQINAKLKDEAEAFWALTS